ncbi:MAG: glycosyltransferase [Lachnospiraceae bacterium]|nr:glycosyltransferase [Lachnospiraceae bacterium]
MEMPRFSLVVWTRDTNEVFFRDFMESMVAQTYDNWELYIIDEGRDSRIATIASEFFPEDHRVHYRQLRTNRGKAYAYNIGFHFALLDGVKCDEDAGYIVVADQHDRLSPGTLATLAEYAKTTPDIIYTDHDELVGVDRMSPHFKSELNKELLIRSNYIGEFVAVSHSAARRIGEFQEKLTYAVVYDYLLRGMERDMSFVRVPALVYHHRVLTVENRKEFMQLQEKNKREHMMVAEASLRRRGIAATLEAGSDISYWKVNYDGDDAYAHPRDYLLLRSQGVRPLTRHNVERMYGFLRQKDVAVVGARFIKSGFTLDNCGYLYDAEGGIYPAFYNQKLFRPTYEQLGQIPRDVSMVDAAYCMIDAKAYRKLGGFDPKLSGRDVMLDFCLRAKKAELRIVVDPGVIARNNAKSMDSTQGSRELLLERWGDILANGDPMYNPNMNLGLENFGLGSFDI